MSAGTAAAVSMSIRRALTADILRGLARCEAARLGKLAGMAQRAGTPREIDAILRTAARGAQTVTPGRPDWQERAVFLLGEAAVNAEPDTYGCCHPDELCPNHSRDTEAAALVARFRDAVKLADSPEDAGMRIAEIIAGGAGR
jgi:hypothetical protein